MIKIQNKLHNMRTLPLFIGSKALDNSNTTNMTTNSLLDDNLHTPYVTIKSLVITTHILLMDN